MGRLRQAARSPALRSVLAYLSRYTHRVAISSSRLVSLDHARGVDLPLEGLPPQWARPAASS